MYGFEVENRILDCEIALVFIDFAPTNVVSRKIQVELTVIRHLGYPRKSRFAYANSVSFLLIVVVAIHTARSYVSTCALAHRGYQSPTIPVARLEDTGWTESLL